MRAHEAGALHADITARGPAWLREPADANALVPLLWSSTAHKNDDGALVIGGVDLRDLARGIYPPLLMDRGLPEALQAAANRSVLPTDVTADVGRFPPELEAAVYFCCLEAIQNAGKHAGEGARITITVEADAAELRFEVADDGAGFNPQVQGLKGHGFVNMADRVGSIGGSLEVEAAPGAGTKVRGRIPLLVEIPSS